MKEESIKKLKEKYYAGSTSLQEEKQLIQESSQEDSSTGRIASFLKDQQQEAPKGFNDELWESFEEKIVEEKKPSFWIWSAAASIVIVLSFYFFNLYQGNVDEIHKQALLEEAKSMFIEQEEPIKTDKILFEDETLIVYTSTEN
ncbi:MAG: hypothetical protein CMB99_02970 [Flavobacteriaceae bacterium]|nr:hypothetical protein [Flavobacteriaceae bacterium]|tara:strand:- start:93983 stop:94414 length:432 start_codon:yes stop_codon:yes gene_type:complete